jgi:hypothetical protein
VEVYGWGEVKRTVLAAPQPAAGVGVTVSVPESEYQTLVAVAFRLVTSATIATRTPVVSVTDGSGVNLIGVAAGYGTTAGSTADYSFAAGLGEWDQSNNANASGGLISFPLDGGDSIVISVGAIDATDQLSRVRVTLLQRAVRQ